MSCIGNVGYVYPDSQGLRRHCSPTTKQRFKSEGCTVPNGLHLQNAIYIIPHWNVCKLGWSKMHLGEKFSKKKGARATVCTLISHEEILQFLSQKHALPVFTLVSSHILHIQVRRKMNLNSVYVWKWEMFCMCVCVYVTAMMDWNQWQVFPAVHAASWSELHAMTWHTKCASYYCHTVSGTGTSTCRSYMPTTNTHTHSNCTVCDKIM